MNDGDAEKETPAEDLGDPDEGVVAFAATQVTTVEDTATPVGEIYEQYEEYADEHQYEIRNRSQFARVLKESLDEEFTTETKRVDGDPTRVYIGIKLASR